jgi:cell division protein FtsB
MAFTVNDLRDLLEILRTMPEWKEALRRELLGDELLALPGLVRKLMAAVEEMNRRLARVEQDIAEMNRRLTRVEQDVEVLKADVGVLKADVEVLKADVGVLKADVEVLKADVGVLKADVEVLKADVEVLKADVEVLKADVEVLKADVGVLKTDVATLKGDSLERKYRERPFVYFRRIVRKSKVLTDSEIEELLSQAQASGALSEADVDEISRLDVIVCGRRITDDSVAYLAVEVSAKIDDYDVERAVRRAKLLEKIPGVVAIPVVAGEQLAPEGRRALMQTTAWAVVDGSAIESTSSAI